MADPKSEELADNMLNLLRHLQEAELFVFLDLKFCQTASYLTACEFLLSRMNLTLMMRTNRSCISVLMTILVCK